MGEVPPGHDAVRSYLDSAVAEAADRWVGRAADATAYADLVAAVLARREALSPLSPFGPTTQVVPLTQLDPSAQVSSGVQRHVERRSRPRWPQVAVEPGPSTPFSAALEGRPGPGLPSRPPGRHRQPPREDLAPRAIDLSHNLTTVLDWLGRPES
jgi:hypothetical protein